MPRSERIKYPEAVFHVMARSISEFDLFPSDDDKNRFLEILKICTEKFQVLIYYYCLMSNHYHILLDANGCDISKFMKSLNQRYVLYIKKQYKQKGHLLGERFNSRGDASAQTVFIGNNWRKSRSVP